MRILYCGHGDPGVRCLEQIVDACFEVVMVFTHPETVEVNTDYEAKSVYAFAKNNDLPVMIFSPSDKNKIFAEISRLDPDLIVSVNWRALFSKEMLDVPSLGAVNLHGSLLPRWRGNSPVTWALINGDDVAGATVHYIDEGMDTGDILGQFHVPVEVHDTIVTLKERIALGEGDLLVKVLGELRDGIALPRGQSECNAAIAKKRRPEDGKIDWNWSSRRIYDWVRAMTYPLPGAFTSFQGQLLRIWRVSSIELPTRVATPGTVVSLKLSTTSTYLEPVIAAGSGLVVIEKATLGGWEKEGLKQILEKNNFIVNGRLGD